MSGTHSRGACDIPVDAPGRINEVGGATRYRATQGHCSDWSIVRRAGAVLLAGILAACTSTPSPSASTPSSAATLAAPSSAKNSPTPAPTGGITTAPVEAWGQLELPPIQPIANLAPDEAARGGIATTARLRLTSLTSTPAVQLAHRLTTTPAADLSVTPGPDARTALLRPKKPLQADRLYRFTLRMPDGSLGGSWVYQTEKPLEVSSTIPGPEATGVPTNTGIEITFNQDGAGDIAQYFSIEPWVAGRFEPHGRAWVYVPEKLSYATIYTVALRRGVPLTGSHQVLAADLRFSFETEPKPVSGSVPKPPPQAHLQRPILEVTPTEAPVLGVWVDTLPNDSRQAVSAVDLRVYRLPSFADAIAAARTLLSAPGWADWSDQGLVPTASLAQVASFKVKVQTVGTEYNRRSFITFPKGLDRGWYLVVRPAPDRDQQLLLQVTDVATYVTTTTTRLIAWVNDVSTGAAIAGATLYSAGGLPLGLTDTDGLVTAPTPAELQIDADARPSDQTLLVAAPDAGPVGAATAPGRAAIVPLGSGGRYGGYGGYRGYEEYWGGYWGSGIGDAYWRLLYTDRTLYRSTDSVNAWGMIRKRADGSVPAGVELRLQSSQWNWSEAPEENAALAISRVAVKPNDATGAFAVPVRLDELPTGSYSLQLWCGKDLVANDYFEVGQIRKPSYTIDVTTDRHVLVEGDTVTATVRTAFFEGTPVSNVELDLEGLSSGGSSTRVVTGLDGSTSVTALVPFEGDRVDWQSRNVSASPTHSEEAEIPVSDASMVVFPSRVILDGKAVIDGSRIVARGQLRALDQAKAERQWLATDGSEWDPGGGPAAGSTVHARVTDSYYVAIKTGRAYDPISKTVQDTYRYEQREKALGQLDTVTLKDGSYEFAVARSAQGLTPPKDHSYRVDLSARDADGRIVALTLWAYAPEAGPPLTGEEPLTIGGEGVKDTYAVGEKMRIPLRWGWSGSELAARAGSRYLFFWAQMGLQGARVQDTPLLVRSFAEGDIPDIGIGAVWFTGRTYLVAANRFYPRFDPAERTLTVQLTPEAARYRPGDTVTLGVRTVNRDGAPVPASVTLRAIDEKLYAMGAAEEASIVDDLYVGVPSGILRTYASHPVPDVQPTGGGSTAGGGGGPRVVFSDWILFKQVTTDAGGRASVSFKLSDDLTSWRVLGAALGSRFEAGESSVKIPVGLPFFIEAPLAPDFVAGDQPTLTVRAYGSALREGSDVTFTIAAPSLGMRETSVQAKAFAEAQVPLPTLAVGDYRVSVTATSGSGASVLRDTLVRPLHVVASRFTQPQVAYSVLPAPPAAASGTGMATYVFTDAGRGQYLSRVWYLVWSGGSARVDSEFAALIARKLLVQAFGVDPKQLGDTAFDPSAYLKAPAVERPYNQGRGVALLSYGSADLALSARVSLAAADMSIAGDLSTYFQGIRGDDTMTSEEHNLALAGLAGLGEPVLGDIRSALADPNLPVRQQLYLALGAAVLGDQATALGVERGLLSRLGQRLGPWVRLNVGTTLDDTLEATSLLALIAVTVGDPLAEAAEAYVEEHPGKEDLYDLQQAAYLREAVEWAPAAAARFGYSVGGTSREIDLSQRGSYSLTLTPAQRATLTVRQLEGRTGIAVSWEQPVAPATIREDPSLSLSRSALSTSPIPRTSVVMVAITPGFRGSLTMNGCYRVVDVAPSGLAPLQRVSSVAYSRLGSGDQLAWDISGQRVTFCALPSTVRLVYFARVVMPGSFVWEPALIQAVRATESIALSSADRVEIR